MMVKYRYRKAINITNCINPKVEGSRFYLMGFELGFKKNGCRQEFEVTYGDRFLFDFVAERSDSLTPALLYVNINENVYWCEDIQNNGTVFDLRFALEKHFSGCFEKNFDASDMVYIFGSYESSIMLKPTSILVRSHSGSIFWGDSVYADDADLHITKYISYIGNNNRHSRKTLSKLVKGERFNNEDFCQLLLNMDKRKLIFSCDDPFYFTHCKLYTNKFIYECRNGNIIITVNGREYYIASEDLSFKDFYVVRLLHAAKEGNLEKTIVEKYPATLIHMIIEQLKKDICGTD